MPQRQVNQHGQNQLAKPEALSNSELGRMVGGIQRRCRGFIEVWFVRLLLGHVDQNNFSFLWDIPPQAAGRKPRKIAI
jgi:hypothetical protein